MQAFRGYNDCEREVVVYMRNLALRRTKTAIRKITWIFFTASGVGQSPLYCGHFWPIVPAPDDR
jgi:hypothetical protein